MIQADYYRQVVITIPGIAGGNTGSDFTFNDQPDLRYARMIAMEAYFAEDLSHAQPQPVPVIPGALAPKVSLVFRTNDPDDLTKKKGANGQFTGTLDTIQWLPLTAIHLSQSFGTAPGAFVRNAIAWRDRYIVWQNSHVKIAPGGLGNTTDVSIVLGCYYSFLNTEGKEITPRN